jgi:hypothetical protein
VGLAPLSRTSREVLSGRRRVCGSPGPRCGHCVVVRASNDPRMAPAIGRRCRRPRRCDDGVCGRHLRGCLGNTSLRAKDRSARPDHTNADRSTGRRQYDNTNDFLVRRFKTNLDLWILRGVQIRLNVTVDSDDYGKWVGGVGPFLRERSLSYVGLLARASRPMSKNPVLRYITYLTSIILSNSRKLAPALELGR